jgi:hypothetical protein
LSCGGDAAAIGFRCLDEENSLSGQIKEIAIACD